MTCLVLHLRIDVGRSPSSVVISDIHSVFWEVLLVVREWERKEYFELKKVAY